jgi:hypothetical protein
MTVFWELAIMLRDQGLINWAGRARPPDTGVKLTRLEGLALERSLAGFDLLPQSHFLGAQIL